MENKWDKRFLEMASLVSTWSKDPSTKIGCVIVNSNRNPISLGYNGFTSYTLNEETLYDSITRKEKHQLTIHGELNAILNAAKNNASVKGARLYVNYPCCNNCALAIVQSGIRTVVYIENNILKPGWEESTKLAEHIFKEAGVDYYGVKL